MKNLRIAFALLALFIILGAVNVYASDRAVIMPEDGLVIQITEPTLIQITVPTSGIWFFETSHQANWPAVDMWLMDDAGNVIFWEELWDSRDSRRLAALQAGTVYHLDAGAWSFSGGEKFTLTIRPAVVAFMPPGGSKRVSEETLVSFTPNESGLWIIETSDRTAHADPIISVFYGSELLRTDDDGAGNLNARIDIRLEARQEYHIHAGFFGLTTGEYNLSVRVMPSLVLPPGGSLEITEAVLLSFIPDMDGRWVFETEEVGDGIFPALSLYRGERRLDTSGLHWGTTSPRISHLMRAGQEYYFVAQFFGASTGQYVLSASHTPIQTLPPGGSIQLSGTFNELMFVPSVTGLWSFEITGFTDYDVPHMELHQVGAVDFDGQFMTSGIFIIEDFLTAGREYILFVDVWDSWGLPMEFYVSAYLVPMQELVPGGSVQAQIDRGVNYFRFVPNTTGFWVMEIYGLTDNQWPEMVLYEAGHIDWWDGFVADGMTRLSASLIAGREYILMVNMWGDVEVGEMFEVRTFPMPTEVLRPDESLRITQATIVNFTPNASGVWAFELSDITSDVWHWLRLYIQGEFVTSLWGDVTPIILREGEDVTITAAFRWADYGGYTLSAYLFPVLEVPASGVVLVEGEDVLISFVPDTSADWEFELLPANGFDGFIILDVIVFVLDFENLDDDIYILAEMWWDGQMEDLGAVISAELSEGGSYLIWIWNQDLASLKLNIRALP